MLDLDPLYIGYQQPIVGCKLKWLRLETSTDEAT
ncbi:unnamed protein product [Spirodela intermedia]|uniref:Uncharacterized protein n=1 Tax=Spirodela intermedia TaxID=51605 RepID=A0A7I8II66_SPIIN|nr:unnamed protein product [Spirodela intermedia]CAA6657190.1 unnamed protein product [Spirodela intermedia]